MQNFHFISNMNYPKKTNKFYKYTTDGGCLEYRNITNLHELRVINRMFNNGIIINENNCKIKIIIYTRPFDKNCGGILALHNLAKYINDMKNPEICAKLFIYNGLRYKNNFCEDFASIEEASHENAIVVYPEAIRGNPLNCKKVIRWILLELGKEKPLDHCRNWGKNDLVYYFNSELKFNNNPERMGSIYKMLNCLFINPLVSNYNVRERSGTCFSYRKSIDIKNMHNREIHTAHPEGSFEITKIHTQMQCIHFFNKYKWFMCYDPLTFYIVISALCGCIPVVYKIEGFTKLQWIQSTAAAEYIKCNGLDNLYGIAYGREDMEYAESTIHLVREQWENIIKFNKETTMVPFIKDVQEFENALNTVQNNYYI
jgi:hypothetical protein